MKKSDLKKPDKKIAADSVCVLQLDNISYTYDPGTPFAAIALRDISLSIVRGETLILMGKPGSGKSTLIQLLNGLLRPSSGRVILNGTDIYADRRVLPTVRHEVGLVFQYPEHQLFAASVGEDIAFGPRMMGLGSDEVERRVTQALDFVGLDSSFNSRSPHSLSSGQKRLAALAGVMAMKPKVLVLDEPTAGLDPGSSRRILERLKTYQFDNRATLIIATHTFDDAASQADRIVVLDEGRIARCGSPDDIFGSDQDEEISLTAYGLQKPEITRLMQRLAAKGVPVNPGTVTVENAATQILALYAQIKGTKDLKTNRAEDDYAP
jgi:energy-coupling factor transport system ATP-binding protein